MHYKYEQKFDSLFCREKKIPDCNYLIFQMHNCGNDYICFYKLESNDSNFHFHVINLSNLKVRVR